MFPGTVPVEGSKLRLYTEASAYKTGDIVDIRSYLEDAIETDDEFAILSIYNPDGEIVLREYVETETGKFHYQYTINGPLNPQSGQYRVEVTFGGQFAETTFEYNYVATDPEGWIPFTAKAGNKTYNIGYKMAYFELKEVTVDLVTKTMRIVIKENSHGHGGSELRLKYPHDLFPFEITEVIRGDNSAWYQVRELINEKVLKTGVAVYNNQPAEILVFGEGTRPSLSEETGDEQNNVVVVTGLRITNTYGSVVTECSNCLSSMLMLTSEIKNHLYTTEQFAVYLEVRDLTGYTVFNEFAIGTINPVDSIKVAMSWMPEKAGNYEVRSFVIDDPQNMRWISPIKIVRIVVS
ncbi:MAG: hypothetical protein AB1351_01325 [Thermoproteota archaeon]